MSQHKKVNYRHQSYKKVFSKKGGEKVGQGRQNIPMLNEKVIENESKNNKY